MQRPTRKKAYFYSSYLLLSLSILLILFTAFRGLAFPDEGYIVNAGQRILDGQVIYRDFDFVYTPLPAYASSLSFLLFGTSIRAERILAFILSLITAYILFRLGKILTGNPLLQLVPVLVYIAWGPTHINFVNPGIWSVNYGIIGFCLLYEAVIKKRTKLFYLSGLSLAAVMLTKQNFAVAVILSLGLLILSVPALRIRSALFKLTVGILIPLGIFFLSLLFTGSLFGFLENMYVNVFQQMILSGSLNTPLFTGPNILIALFKLLFYTSPITLSLIAISILWRKKEKSLLILTGFVAVFYLLGFRPETDYVHLSPLLALSGISLLTLIIVIPAKKQFNNFYKKFFTILLISCFVLLTALGLWSSFFFGYYRWSPPLIGHNTFIKNPRIDIWTDRGTIHQIQTVSNLLNKYSRPNEEVFLNYYAPMVYFITDRRNPTRYDYIGLPEKYQKDLVQTLEQKKIRTILTFYLNKNDNSQKGKYILLNYQLKESLGEYEIWHRIK